MVRASLLALAAVLASGSPASCLDPSRRVSQYPLQVWQSDQGLPQNSVNAIVRTPDGYLWVGTQAGLARFDGISFTIFDRGNTPALMNSTVNALCAGQDGVLWIGTDAGVTSLRQAQFRRYPGWESLPFPQVLDLSPGARGEVWVGTYGGGLSRISSGPIRSFGAGEGLADPHVLFLLRLADGAIVVGSRGGRLAVFREGVFAPIPLPAPGGKAVLAEAAAEVGGVLWVGTDEGLFCMAGGRLVPARVPPSLAHERVTRLLQDREGSLWIGTAAGRLHRLRGDDLQTLGIANGLPAAPISALYEDLHGNLWVGTDGGGLVRLKDGSVVTLSAAEGLSADWVTSVQEALEGGLWIATNGGGLDFMRGGRVTAHHVSDGLRGEKVWTVLQLRDGSLAVGTSEGGLCRLSGGRISEMPLAAPLAGKLVIALLEDHQGNVWAGTAGDGLFRLGAGEARHFAQSEGLPNPIVHVLYEDSAGRIWAGTEGGLALFDGARFRAFTSKDGRFDFVLSLYEDPEGLLWVGTGGGGLNLFRGGAFKAVTRADGLFDDTVLQIVPDGGGSLWLSCTRGIFKVSRKDLIDFVQGRRQRVSCVAYGKADGMKDADCSGGLTGTGVRLSDGRICFATRRGVAFVNPASGASDRTPPPVVVEGISYDGWSVSQPTAVKVPLGIRRLEIRYTGLDLYAPEKVSFRYRMEGIDPEWVEAGTRRVAYYSNLGPGRYVFSVTACNSEGEWNAAGAKVSLEIPPRFYETAWAYLLEGLCLILLGVLAYHLRVRRLRARQRELTVEVERSTGALQEAYEALEVRTRELEVANRKLEKISIQDALTGLANRRHFESCLDVEWRRAERVGTPVALLMLDVDYFKDYNDAYGHLQGDRCLQVVAAHLRRSFRRATDTPARLGGDEFCVLLVETPLEEALEQAEKLRRAVEEMGISHRASRVAGVVTVSVGAAAAEPGPGESPEALMDAADRFLYRAKNLGRNRVFGSRAAGQGSRREAGLEES